MKYKEEKEVHSSDLRSDLEEVDYIPGPALEEVDTIDFVLDHRIGKSGISFDDFSFG